MRHDRIETPAYLIWVEARPSFNGKGKDAYYAAVKAAAREQIQTPITASDIEVEIFYSTTSEPGQRIDTDNIQKPTLDALKGIAYPDDGIVRHAESTLFDRRTIVGQVNGRVEYIGRLFFSPHPHVVLIRIYSDTRLRELGGEAAIQRARYEEFDRDFDQQLRQARSAATIEQDDEFIETAGVYRDRSTGHYVCPRCRADDKRSLLTVGKRGFSCPVCTGFFPDSSKTPPRSNYGGPFPRSWMA